MTQVSDLKLESEMSLIYIMCDSVTVRVVEKRYKGDSRRVSGWNLDFMALLGTPARITRDSYR